MNGSHDKGARLGFETPIAFQQAAAVQNTWYTVLTIANRAGLLKHIFPGMDTANEDLEVEVTIDGELITPEALNCVADTDYECYFFGDVSATVNKIGILAVDGTNRALDLPFKESLLIRARKTSVVGAGELFCGVIYALR